jgi:iron complex transport system substrate-binding protein
MISSKPSAVRLRDMRIVSLLPSATESICVLGHEAQAMLVGRSHECDFPSGLATGNPTPVPVVTAQRIHAENPFEIDTLVRQSRASGQSLYVLHEELIESLKPDLILTQDLCDVCSIDLPAVQALARRISGSNHGPKVITLNPHTVEGVFDDILTISKETGLQAQGIEALTSLRARMYGATEYVNQFAAIANVAVLEWTDPLFIGGHWTPQLVERAGGFHPLNPTEPIAGAGAAAGPIGITQRTAGKSIAIAPEILVASRPEALIIAPCGRTLAQALTDTHALSCQPWFADLPAAKAGKVAVVDGNQFFNRPGPRLVDALEFLVGFLNDRPEVIPPTFAWKRWQS